MILFKKQRKKLLMSLQPFIVQCPKCDSEGLLNRNKTYAKRWGVGFLNVLCLRCGYKWKSYTKDCDPKYQN